MSDDRQFKQVPKTGQSTSPSETILEQPATTPVDIGQLSGGEYQQFASRKGGTNDAQG